MSNTPQGATSANRSNGSVYFRDKLKVFATSAFSGKIIAIVTQPPYVLKVKAQQSKVHVPYKELSSRIMEKEGIRGYWDGLTPALVKSPIKQGMKGFLYAGADDLNAHPVIKAVLSGTIMTSVLTPFDRTASAFIAHGTMNRRVILRNIWAQGGVSSFYRGARVDFSKNIVEAGVVYGIREVEERYKVAIGKDRELSTGEWFILTFGATWVKLLSTNFMDVSKSEIQKSINNKGKALTMRQVLKVKGPRHFFLAGIGARFFGNYLAIAVSTAMLKFNDYLRKEARRP